MRCRVFCGCDVRLLREPTWTPVRPERHLTSWVARLSPGSSFFRSSLKYCPPVQQDIASVLEIPQDIDQRQRVLRISTTDEPFLRGLTSMDTFYSQCYYEAR